MNFIEDTPFITLDENFNIVSVSEKAEPAYKRLYKADYFKNLLCGYSIRDFEQPVFINAYQPAVNNFGFVFIKDGEHIKCHFIKSDNRQTKERQNLISYQMREPISSIFALLPIIVDNVNGGKPDKAISHLEEIYAKSYKLLRNVTNISLAEKISSGSLSKSTAINLSSLLESIASSVKTIIKSITINCDIAKDVVIYANSGLITNGILNIISNSINFSTDEPVEIFIKLSVLDGKAVFTYKDNSKGIRPEYQPMVFNPYFSKDPYGDEGVDHELGLGLYIAKSAFNMAGGNIFLTSSFGEGVKYTVSMPLCSENELIMESCSTDFLLNRFSEVFVQLCDRCSLPSLK